MGWFRGVGVLFVVFGAVLALLTYLFVGVIPLVALGIGLVIIGLSIYSTPEEPIRRGELLAVIEDLLSNLSLFLETLNFSTVTTYVSYGDEGVYIFVSEEPVGNPPSNPPKSMIAKLDDKVVLVLRSPISGIVRRFFVGVEDVGSFVSYVLVDLLELCDSVSYIVTPGRLEKTVGSIYTLMLASIAALIYKSPVQFLSEEVSGDRRIISLRVLR